jgi:hypothetical protein
LFLKQNKSGKIVSTSRKGTSHGVVGRLTNYT